VAHGPSGLLSVILDNISDDTSILARQTAIQHLEGQLQRLQQRKSELASRILGEWTSIAQSSPPPQPPASAGCFAFLRKYGCVMAIAILFTIPLAFAVPFVLWVLVETSLESVVGHEDAQYLTWLLTGLLGLGLMLAYERSQKKSAEWAKRRKQWEEAITNQVHAKYRVDVDQVEEQITGLQQRVATLRTEIDRLIGNL